jgi:septum site-determining protein MinD
MVVASGKGGVGKTSLCANVAANLSKRGNRVLLIDCDFGLRNLDLVLGVSDRTVFDLSDVLFQRAEPQKAAIVHPEYPNLYFIAAPQSYSKGDISPDVMREFIMGIKDEFDFVICDSPAGVGEGFCAASSGAELGIIVCTADSCSVRDAEKTAFCLEKTGIDKMRLVVNRVRPELIEKGVCMNIDDIIDSVKVQLLGLIPYEPAMEGVCGLFPANKGQAGLAFSNIARRLMSEEVPLIRIKRKGFFGG